MFILDVLRFALRKPVHCLENAFVAILNEANGTEDFEDQRLGLHSIAANRFRNASEKLLILDDAIQADLLGNSWSRDHEESREGHYTIVHDGFQTTDDKFLMVSEPVARLLQCHREMLARDSMPFRRSLQLSVNIGLMTIEQEDKTFVLYESGDPADGARTQRNHQSAQQLCCRLVLETVNVLKDFAVECFNLGSVRCLECGRRRVRGTVTLSFPRC